MNNLKFAISKVDTATGVKFILQGHVNSINAEDLEKSLEETIKSEVYDIVLNMLRVDYLSSAGIKVILKAYKDASRAGGRLGIEGPSENVRNVLGMTALDKLLIK
ncbi:MAG: STAS domain-containing protein [Treponema sp.]|nr:STAS domain-containing protein [Treponema sp.]